MGLEHRTKDVKVIACDGCGAEMPTGPHVVDSGWTKRGSDHGPGTEKHEVSLCETCSLPESRR